MKEGSIWGFTLCSQGINQAKLLVLSMFIEPDFML